MSSFIKPKNIDDDSKNTSVCEIIKKSIKDSVILYDRKGDTKK